MLEWLGGWVQRTDGWTWVKLGGIVALALVAGTLRRRQLDEQRAKAIAEQNKGRFVDPFDP